MQSVAVPVELVLESVVDTALPVGRGEPDERDELGGHGGEDGADVFHGKSTPVVPDVLRVRKAARFHRVNANG
jgi:hypothetical protein